MKKIVLAIALVALTSVFSFAQEGGVKFGVRVAYNMQHPTGDGAKDDESGESLEWGLLGFGIGGVANIPITSQLSFNPGLNFLYRRAFSMSDSYKEYGATVNVEVYESEFALGIPLMFQFAPAGGFYLGAGVQLDIPFSAKITAKATGSENGVSAEAEETRDLDDRASPDFGIALGFGFYATENIGIDFRAVIGLTEIVKDSKTQFNQYGIGLTCLF
jgi:hypothetical protein